MFILRPGLSLAALIAFLLNHEQLARAEAPLIVERLTDSTENSWTAISMAMGMAGLPVNGCQSVRALQSTICISQHNFC